MKKRGFFISALALLLAALLLLTACGGSSDDSESESQSENDQTESENSETDSGNEESDNVVIVQSENYEITNAMLTYYEFLAYNNTFYQYFNFYYSYLQDMNMAYSYAQMIMKDYTPDDFFDTALTTAKEILVLCETALTENLTLNDQEIDAVDQTMDEFDGQITDLFGANAKEEDIRTAVELEILANKVYEDFYEKNRAGITDTDIENYIAANKDQFYVADYLKYTISVKASDYTDNTAAYEDAKFLAAQYRWKLASAKTEKEFSVLVIRHYMDSEFFDSIVNEQVPAEIRPNAEALAVIKASMTEDLITEFVEEKALNKGESTTDLDKAMDKVYAELKNAINITLVSVKKQQAYTADPQSDTVRWLIKEDGLPFSTTTEESSSDEEFSITVYMLVNPLHLNEKETVNVGHILVMADQDKATEEELAAAEEKAKNILDQYLAGEKTRESFEALAKENTDDSGVFYETVTPGQMVPEFDEWIFSESRQAIGETAIVKTTYGYHVMYWDGKGENTAVTAAKTGILDSRYLAFVEQGVKNLTINQEEVDKHAKS